MSWVPASDPASGHPAPPRLVVWLALAVCVAGTVVMLVGAWRVGVWTDEPTHVQRYENLLQHGWYLLDDDLVGDTPGAWVTDQYVYAPVFAHLSHAVNRLVGLDGPGAVGVSVEAYAVRHLVVAACGLLGVLAVGAIARRLLGSWRWGVVAAATLMAVPMWPGLSMFDIKDVPAATGYTLVTLGLVELISRERASVAKTAGYVAILTSGLVLTIGTRPGLWPALAVSLLLATFVSLRRGNGSPRRVTFGPLVEIGIACAMATALLLLAYPAYFTAPLDWLTGSTSQSSGYATSTGGGVSNAWAYIPARVLSTMPTLLLLVGVVGCLMSLRHLPRRLTPQVGGWLLVGSQALLLPLLAAIQQSVLNDDLRQILFACPAVALMLTAGWRQVFADLAEGSRIAGSALVILWSLALLAPVVAQAQLFPYAYTYASPLVSRSGPNDWARVSLRELVPGLDPGDFVICQPLTSPDGQTMRYRPPGGRPAAEGSSDCGTDPLGTVTPYTEQTGPGDHAVVQDTFLALFTRGPGPGSNCEALESISRQTYAGRVPMSTVARCDLVLSAYPSSGAKLGPDGSGAEFLLGGWSSSPAREGVQLREPVGSLGFVVPEPWTDRPLWVELDGEAARVPEVRVNNEPVVARPTGSGWVLDVPAETVAAIGEGRLVITLSQPAEEQLTLTGVSLQPR
jgi:hypothetical protein